MQTHNMNSIFDASLHLMIIKWSMVFVYNKPLIKTPAFNKISNVNVYVTTGVAIEKTSVELLV